MTHVLIVDAGPPHAMVPVAAYGPFRDAEEAADWRVHHQARWHTTVGDYATRVEPLGAQGDLRLVAP